MASPTRATTSFLRTRSAPDARDSGELPIVDRVLELKNRGRNLKEAEVLDLRMLRPETLREPMHRDFNPAFGSEAIFPHPGQFSPEQVTLLFKLDKRLLLSEVNLLDGYGLDVLRIYMLLHGAPVCPKPLLDRFAQGESTEVPFRKSSRSSGVEFIPPVEFLTCLCKSSIFHIFQPVPEDCDCQRMRSNMEAKKGSHHLRQSP